MKNISVLVGPNNSGKSETLREIEGWTAPNLEQKLLQEVHMELPHSGEDTDSLFLRYKAEPAPGLALLEGQIYVSYPYFNTTLEKVLSL